MVYMVEWSSLKLKNKQVDFYLMLKIDIQYVISIQKHKYSQSKSTGK
jgi:hypothetical protein